MNELATEKERVEFCWTMSIALDGRLRYFHAAMVDLASIIVVIRRMRLLYVTKYILQRFFPTILNLLFFKDIFCIFLLISKYCSNQHEANGQLLSFEQQQPKSNQIYGHLQNIWTMLQKRCCIKRFYKISPDILMLNIGSLL